MPTDTTEIFELWNKKASIEISKEFHEIDFMDTLKEAIELIPDVKVKAFIKELIQNDNETKINLVDTAKSA